LADIVLVGSAPAGKALRRSTARVGDFLYVTGRLGGSAAELRALQDGAKPAMDGDHPQIFPVPRLAVGEALLRRRLATACIDLSDGLSSDLKHLCEASGLSAEVDMVSLPIHRLAAGRMELALHGGEDYELLFAAKAGAKMPRSIAGVTVTRIGKFVERTRPLMVRIDESGRRCRLDAGGWEHQIG
jgi:thiamine-monophosphate kinase